MAVEMIRFDVFLVALDPTLGREIKNTRPCVIVSPDEMNLHIGTVIVAPMSTRGRNYPTRVNCVFQGRPGQIILDQLRTVDKVRLVKKLGRVSTATGNQVVSVLVEMFQK